MIFDGDNFGADRKSGEGAEVEAEGEGGEAVGTMRGMEESAESCCRRGLLSVPEQW